MRAARWNAPQELELTEVDAPVAGPGQLVLDVAACGICGSDLHSYASGFAATPGQVLGHELSGRVREADGVAGVAVGDRVTVRPLTPCGACPRCLEGEIQLCEAGHALNIGYGTPGGFADRVLVPKAQVGLTVFPLPDEVDDRAGALVEPLAVSLRAVHQADPAPDAVAVVLGAGMIGLGVVRLLRLRGVGRIVVSDPSPARRAVALELGADVACDPLEQPLVDAVAAITGPGAGGRGARADVVVDCAGSGPALLDGIKATRHGGTLVIAAVHGRKIELNPTRIMEKELRVVGSLGYRDEFAAVVDLLRRGEIDADAFISHELPLDRIDEAFRLQLGRGDAIKVLVRP